MEVDCGVNKGDFKGHKKTVVGVLENKDFGL